MADYIPGADAEFNARLDNFVTCAGDHLVGLGLVQTDIDPIVSAPANKAARRHSRPFYADGRIRVGGVRPCLIALCPIRLFSAPSRPSGARASVWRVVKCLLELVAGGASRDDILRDYPDLTAEDVEEALRYAACLLQNEVVIRAELKR